MQPTAQFALQVELFLANPDTRALVEAAPQAGRILRPLCRGLNLTPPDWLRLPDRPQPAPRESAKPVSTAAPPDPPRHDRPIPPYVPAAARAWKKHDR